MNCQNRSAATAMFALSEIPSQFLNNLITKKGHEQKKFHFLNQNNLNEKQISRLQELKCKYLKKESMLNTIYLKKSVKKQQTVQNSFKRIYIENLKVTESEPTVQSSKLKNNFKDLSSFDMKTSQFYQKNFEKKIQQLSCRVQSNISRVEDKLNRVKMLYSQTNLEGQQNENGLQLKEENNLSLEEKNNYEKQITTIQTLKTEIIPQIESQIQNKSFNVRSQYAAQLKGINYVHQIKKKISEIQTQKLRNIQKKESLIFEDCLQKNPRSDIEKICNKEVVTLAKLTPNLAQSQIIQTTERERFVDYGQSLIKTPATELIASNNYLLSQRDYRPIKTHPYDQIIEEPQNQNISFQGSPALPKSPQSEAHSLQETHFVQSYQLQGNLEILQTEVQKQFTLLINRLAYQAQIDYKFVCEVFKYQNVLTQKKPAKELIMRKLKDHCYENGLQFDESQYQVSQIEVDPLIQVKKISKDYSPEEIIRICFRLKKNCDKNTSYFKMKLLSNFQIKTIQFFIQELQKCHSLKLNQQFTIGHLTSYVNMRTGKNLRNRYFYRILKRIQTDKLPSKVQKQTLLCAFTKKLN